MSKSQHYVSLNVNAHSVAWWDHFLMDWNGVSPYSVLDDRAPGVVADV